MMTHTLKIGNSSQRIAIVMMLFAACAAAADISGRWSGSFSAKPGKESPVYAVLKQDGNKLTGTAGPNESHQLPIKTGRVDGDRLMFEVDMGGGTIDFDVTVVGAELRGKMELSEDGHKDTATVTLKRVG